VPFLDVEHFGCLVVSGDASKNHHPRASHRDRSLVIEKMTLKLHDFVRFRL
jgi:hypothetical protein